jgi:putative membrane protein
MFWGFHGLWLLLPLFLLGKFFWIVILALLIGALVRGFSRRNSRMGFYGPTPTRASAMEILRQRYARGEIDATTFEQMRERLESSNGPSQQ